MELLSYEIAIDPWGSELENWIVKSPLGSAVTETDKKSCLDDPLGYAERVFKFMVMCGDIANVSGVEVGIIPINERW